MILAFIGAVFILAKISESATKLQASSADKTEGLPGLKLALQSTSPGLILASFGLILMIVAILMRSPAPPNQNAAFLLSNSDRQAAQPKSTP
jgi:hypothetical protein